MRSPHLTLVSDGYPARRLLLGSKAREIADEWLAWHDVLLSRTYRKEASIPQANHAGQGTRCFTGSDDGPQGPNERDEKRNDFGSFLAAQQTGVS
jgi:hypothetical protein